MEEGVANSAEDTEVSEFEDPEIVLWHTENMLLFHEEKNNMRSKKALMAQARVAKSAKKLANSMLVIVILLGGMPVPQS